MSDVAYIIEEAFREASLTSELQHATPTQTERALSRLQSIVSAAYGFEVGELLNDWRFATDEWRTEARQRPPVNSRILLDLSQGDTIYFPRYPTSGSRMQIIDVAGNLASNPIVINTNGRLIDTLTTTTLNTNGLNKIWLYDADMANWGTVTPITISDAMPFPADFDDYFITTLAMRLNPRYGVEMGQSSAVQMQKQLSKIRARYAQHQTVGSELGLLVNSHDQGRYRWGWDENSTDAFNRGYPY